MFEFDRGIRNYPIDNLKYMFLRSSLLINDLESEYPHLNFGVDSESTFHIVEEEEEDDDGETVGHSLVLI